MKKTVFITGSSSGIGKATALYFQKNGWNVAASMRKPEYEKDLKNIQDIELYHLDVTDRESVRDSINKAVRKFGKIDVLVNNAAYSLTGPFEGATPDQIQKLYDVDVFGVMNVTREILPFFREKREGTIINISSLGGRIGMPLSSFYASAKWAIEGFSESLRFELGKLGIKVKVVEPGGVKTNFASNAVIVRKKDVPSYEETLKKRLSVYDARKSKLSDPFEIAKVIYRAAQDRSERLRFIAGKDAKLFWNLKKIMTFNMFSALLRRMAG